MIQINLKVKRVEENVCFENITEDGFYLPMAKIDEHGMVTDSLASQWKRELGVVVKAVPIFHIAAIAVGASLLLLAIILSVDLYVRRRRNNYISLA